MPSLNIERQGNGGMRLWITMYGRGERPSNAGDLSTTKLAPTPPRMSTSLKHGSLKRRDIFSLTVISLMDMSPIEMSLVEMSLMEIER
jgi:hypothetical protein